MEFPLEGAREKTAVLIVTLAISALVIFQAAEVWLADYRIHSKDIDLMERGTALLPGDGQVPLALRDQFLELFLGGRLHGRVTGYYDFRKWRITRV